MKRDVEKIADYYGLQNQYTKLVEEMSELTQAICKYQSSGESKDNKFTGNILEKLADVMILWQQIVYLLGYEADKEIRDIAYSKVKRTLERIGYKKKEPEKKSLMSFPPSEIRVPIIEVKDLHSKETHIVGTDIHDSLIIRDGKLCYHNLQNGSGTGFDVFDEYEFVSYDDDDNLMYSEKRIALYPLKDFISIMFAYYEDELREYKILLNDKLLKELDNEDKTEESQ